MVRVLSWCLLLALAAQSLAEWFAPLSVLAQSDRLYVAGERAGQIRALNADTGSELWRTTVGETVSGLAFDSTDANLLVSVNEPKDQVVVLRKEDGVKVAAYSAGRGVCAPVATPNGFLVCNRFENSVVAYDGKEGKVLAQTKVLREPISAVLCGPSVLVAHHLPQGPANRSSVAAALSILESRSLALRAIVSLPTGSTGVRGIALDPTGRWCAIVHSLARYQVPTTQVEHGWMSVNALSILDVERSALLASLVLDEPRKGAANPWAAAWGEGSLYITHAGTHELSRIQVRALMEKLASKGMGALINDLDFLKGIRQRIGLSGKGPRSVVVQNSRVYVANFFSDTIEVLNPQNQPVATWTLEPESQKSQVRLGEEYFHDATLGHQGWQSCATCHPDGRADGLNWDLLNDGIGNPKNTKSLLLSHRTPPAMSLGVRMSAEQAVRSGFRHILFTPPQEPVASAVDAYLRNLAPVRSRGLKTSAVIQRGKELFESAEVGCARCHPSPLYTDLARHQVGTDTKGDRGGYDTPTLIECWRTAPYLHDGSAATMREVLTSRNPKDQHGKTSHLSPEQLEDLEAFLLSL